MLITDVVQVSGRGTSVDFTIDDTSPFDQVIQGLRRYLVDNRGLWSKGSITVNAGLRIGSREQLNELKATIEKESGLTVARFWCSSDTFDQASPEKSVSAPQGMTPAEAPDFLRLHQTQTPARPLVHNEYLLTKPEPKTTPAASAVKTAPSIMPGAPGKEGKPGQAPNPPGSRQDLSPVKRHETNPPPPAPVTQATGEDPDSLFSLSSRAQDTLDKIDYMESRRDTALFVKSTCRSGEIIRYQGDVVVLGDVNPGAEIVAAGDITVFGALRGLAHAGSEGLTKAVIIAYRLESPRLQIGPHVGVAAGPFAGERDKSTGTGPMIAYVRRRSIYVAAFAGRFARYSRGILYEG